MMEETQETQAGVTPALTKELYFAYNFEGMYISTMYLEPEDIPRQVNITAIRPEFKEGFIPWFTGTEWINKPFITPPPPWET